MSEGEDKSRRVKWLAQKLKRKEVIINGISDALALLDTKTFNILEVNQAFLNSYGLSHNQVLGKKCYEITHQLSTPCQYSDSSCPCPLEESIVTGNPSHVEHIHKDSSGQDLYFEITAYPLKDHDGQVTRVIHLSKDITIKKRLEFELREKEKLDSILELAGGASHEINQPLTVIMTGLEQLLKRLRQDNPEHKMVQMILEHAKRLMEVSKKLARITRYASKDYVAGKQVIDLDEASRQEVE